MEQQNDRQNPRPKFDRPKTEWQRDKTFSDPKSGTAVVVSKSVGQNPMYSFQIGRVREDGSVATNLQWRTKRDQATFELETDHTAVLLSLMQQAQEHVVLEMQWNWAQKVDEQIVRDQRRSGGDSHGQNRILRPGKTERDKAKHSKTKPVAKA